MDGARYATVNAFLGTVASGTMALGSIAPRSMIQAMKYTIAVAVHNDREAVLDILETVYRELPTDLVAEIQALWDDCARVESVSFRLDISKE